MLPPILIEEAKYLGHFKIYLRFNDERQGVIDLDSVIKNDRRHIFRELEDLELFKKFQVSYSTIVWENGLDLATEFLYEKLEGNSDHERTRQ